MIQKESRLKLQIILARAKFWLFRLWVAPDVVRYCCDIVTATVKSATPQSSVKKSEIVKPLLCVFQRRIAELMAQPFVLTTMQPLFWTTMA